uniref:6-phosphogluconolactonase n=2 Tax=Phaeomonas parva TaxID=124430 RepID=A0A7S1XM57_9STRA|mmetsp:Transcript_1563/g.4273  ORF Transcript_1563/g.4273 Transcript_1563/m.4273 type:complete len:255 (+) Transcript_1563:84-848(+)
MLCAGSIEPELRVLPDKNAIVEPLREFVAAAAEDAVARRGYFAVALSGGSMVKLLSAAILGGAAPLDISSWKVFFADERFVAPDDADSTYGGYKSALFDKIGAAVFAIDDTMELDNCAADYESRVRAEVGAAEDGAVPQFDLVLLGMGPDGHTASLFPGHALLSEAERLIAPISDSPKPPPQRVTMTLPLLLAASQVAFVATGGSKAPILQAALPSYAAEPTETMAYPVEHVRPASGRLTFFLDAAAAQGSAEL